MLCWCGVVLCWCGVGVENLSHIVARTKSVLEVLPSFTFPEVDVIKLFWSKPRFPQNEDF